MKFIRLVIVFMLMLGWVTAPAQQSQVRPCTEQDLPAANRTRYMDIISSKIDRDVRIPPMKHRYRCFYFL